MQPTTVQISQLLRTTFEGQPWHGNSLRAILADVAPQAAFAKPGAAPYSIADLVAHIIQWRIFAIEKLKGNLAFQIALNSPDEWPVVEPEPANWPILLARLAQSQSDLLAELATFSDEALSNIVPNSQHQYRFSTLLYGVANHDIYHSGQIALLKKLIC